MAACYEKMKNFEEMAEASRSCIKADKTFVKGYFRLAVAQKQLGLYSDCIKTLESGLALQSSNADLKTMKKDVTELVRAQTVATHCATAQQQYKEGDVTAAYKTLQLASRLDGNSPDIAKLMRVVQPAHEKAEAHRKRSLSGPDLFKEKGDELYKNANFEEAIVVYTKCIDGLVASGRGHDGVALKAYANRAACYKQISNFDGVIADCTSVLEVEPDNVKALIRRAQAFEGVERYRFALQDVKTVLAMPTAVTGKANVDLCHQMQHRLQRTVDQLKKMDN
jgi:stress-induced-phosphoprotein 1